MLDLADAQPTGAATTQHSGRQFTARLSMTLLLLPTGLALIWSGGPLLRAGAALCALFAVVEWNAMRSGPRSLSTEFLALSATAAVVAGSISNLVPLIAAIGAAPLALAFSSKGRRISAALAALYLVLPFAAICWLRQISFFLPLVVITVAVTTDLAAYAGGQLIGGQRLSRISPAKTWSGAMSGLLCAMAAAAVLAALQQRPVLVWIGLGLAVSVAAQAGDLLMSMVKRSAGVKNTSSLIPGHGGILDRLDSVMMAAMAGCALAIVIPDIVL